MIFKHCLPVLLTAFMVPWAIAEQRPNVIFPPSSERGRAGHAV